MLAKVPTEFFGTFRSTHEHNFNAVVKSSTFNVIIAVEGKGKKLVKIKISYDPKLKRSTL